LGLRAEIALGDHGESRTLYQGEYHLARIPHARVFGPHREPRKFLPLRLR
jgi:hypothetical protein